MSDESGWTGVVDRHLDQVTTLIMALAALMTAWSGYQSSQWESRRAVAFAESATAKREASRLDLRANLVYLGDLGVLQNYLQARLRGEAEVAEFYRQRLPPRLEHVLAGWEALKAEGGPEVPPHPFALPDYVIPAAEAAQAQMERGFLLDAQAREASENAGRYTRTTVGFAMVLFFAGLAPRGQSRATRLLMMAIAVSFLTAAGLLILTLPMAR